MGKPNLRSIKKTIKDIYQIKTKKSVIYNRSDFLALLDFIRYINKIYPFKDSKLKILLNEFLLSKKINKQFLEIMNSFDTLTKLKNESAKNNLKKVCLKFNMNFILRFLNLYIYLNALLEK